MALISKTLVRNCRYLSNITKPVNCCTERTISLKILANGICSKNSFFKPVPQFNHVNFLPVSFRHYSIQGEKSTQDVQQDHGNEPKKPGLLQRFKQMYRDYWYVLVPVHMVTSAVWFGSFYYAAQSGVDVVGLLQSLGVSEALVAPLKDSNAGYFALAFALYKIAAPLRYAVTVGGTTYAINKLTMLGWIKPVPSKERIKELIQEKKGNLQDRLAESQTQVKDKSTHIVEEMKRYKSEMGTNIKSKMKKM